MGKALLKGLRTVFIGYAIPALTSGIILGKEPAGGTLFLLGTALITLAALFDYEIESK